MTPAADRSSRCARPRLGAAAIVPGEGPPCRIFAGARTEGRYASRRDAARLRVGPASSGRRPGTSRQQFRNPTHGVGQTRRFAALPTRSRAASRGCPHPHHDSNLMYRLSPIGNSASVPTCRGNTHVPGSPKYRPSRPAAAAAVPPSGFVFPRRHQQRVSLASRCRARRVDDVRPWPPPGIHHSLSGGHLGTLRSPDRAEAQARESARAAREHLRAGDGLSRSASAASFESLRSISTKFGQRKRGGWTMTTGRPLTAVTCSNPEQLGVLPEEPVSKKMWIWRASDPAGSSPAGPPHRQTGP